MTTFYKTKDNYVIIEITNGVYFDITTADILTKKPEIIGEYTDSNCTTPVRKSPIISDPAKIYLKNIIEPFRNKVKYITFDSDYIAIILNDDDCMSFPDYDKFSKDFITANKNDKHHYTLEELGL